ncbi:MAG TPA: hydroxymethylbilane synthase [Thermoanaerobaculia bacterium]|nr:hydroxymethylbilane synthase [Thermoanaerobaculia bacterium]
MTTATATRPLRMGTRASALARTQSGAFADELSQLSGRPVEAVIIRTHGDQLSSEGKAPPGGDAAGVFVRALDEALLRNEIDFAVHSLKDVPTVVTSGIVLAAVPTRADPRDAFVVASRHPGATTVSALPHGARVATSSPRRVSQLLRIRPDLVMVAMAGNVDTRLQRLEEGRADALILACAGLDRLGRGGVITRRLEPDEMLGAPAQGALGISCREDDEETREILLKMEDPAARAAATAERELLQFLRGGCRAPVGARGFLEGEERNLRLKLVGRVLSLDGRECLEDEMSEPHTPPPPSSTSKKLPSSSFSPSSSSPSEKSPSSSLSPSSLSKNSPFSSSSSFSLGRALAERLLARGAARLIDAARATTP